MQSPQPPLPQSHSPPPPPPLNYGIFSISRKELRTLNFNGTASPPLEHTYAQTTAATSTIAAVTTAAATAIMHHRRLPKFHKNSFSRDQLIDFLPHHCQHCLYKHRHDNHHRCHWNRRIEIIKVNLFSMSSGASECVSERTNEPSGARERSGQCGASEWVSESPGDLLVDFMQVCIVPPRPYIHHRRCFHQPTKSSKKVFCLWELLEGWGFLAFCSKSKKMIT